jgi:glycosyl hydrolase family 130 (putative beta-1,4-mannooligosaccharide phosphorylase)
LQPHRTDTFKLSPDPLLIEKVRDIVGLYMNPPDHALVFCVDERSQIQALDRTQPLLPLRPGQLERRTHDDKRHGTTLLLCRVEDRRGLSHLCAARSRNGVDGWQIDSERTLMADPKNYPEELWGIEDPRITFVPELQQYVVTYTSYSRGGPGVSLALTKDFRTFERFGVIMPPDDKDSALLPRRIDGCWALIHRPMTTLGVAHVDFLFS